MPFMFIYNNNLFSEKCKINTLREVFDAFVKSWQHNTSVYFKYDEKLWKGTIIREDSDYDGRVVSFTNIRLPNDGYFYTGDYNDDGQLDDKRDDSRAFVSRVAQVLVDRNMIIEGIFLCTSINRSCPNLPTEENDFVEMKYFEAQQRLAIRFWKADENSCITVRTPHNIFFNIINNISQVNFENGFHEGAYLQRQKFTYKLASWKK